eukprot:TRINITY_DN7953_c1_g1_i1.p1 TRINITY_DN7953_c1_g1~~TRINITY_DN7953_c1_g1_i1.p1  ORF type:complete len:346 (+),score=62.61 TRINITY_DN7953_c1_g1_i1:139-1176(+)
MAMMGPVKADRGKRRAELRCAGGGVLFTDPRKRIRRFGAACSDDASSSHLSVTVSMKDRCRVRALDTVQRHVVRQALRGEQPTLATVGGLALNPGKGSPTAAAAHPADYTAGGLCSTGPLPPPRPPPPRRPAPGCRRDSDAMSQGLPSAAEGSLRTPTPASERIDPEEWDDVLFPHRSAPGSQVQSAQSSRVRSILSRCKELRKEIQSERRAASEAQAALERHAERAGIISGPRARPGQQRRAAASDGDAPGEAELIDALRLVAEDNGRAKDRVRAGLRQLLPATPKAVCGNPGFEIACGHQTRRHFRMHYGSHLHNSCALQCNEGYGEPVAEPPGSPRLARSEP